MVKDQVPGKLRTMLDMKLTLGQVLAGTFTTVTTVVAIVIYAHSTFETKTDALKIESRLDKMDDGFEASKKMQTEMYGDVKKISGILEAQMAEKVGRNK